MPHFFLASEWVLLNELLEDAGLNLIICLNGITRVDGVWDSRNTLQLVSFSDRRGYNMDFELGYGELYLSYDTR